MSPDSSPIFIASDDSSRPCPTLGKLLHNHFFYFFTTSDAPFDCKTNSLHVMFNVNGILSLIDLSRILFQLTQWRPQMLHLAPSSVPTNARNVNILNTRCQPSDITVLLFASFDILII